MPTDPENDPQNLIAVVGVVGALGIILVRWILELLRDIPPDPWPAELDQAVRRRDATPVCVECLSPQDARGWFCPHCGFPTGEYVPVLPYLYIFSWGELLRRGVTGPPDRNLGRVLGFAVFSMTQYSLFFPIYWFWLIRKCFGKPICQTKRPDLKFEDESSSSDAGAPESDI